MPKELKSLLTISPKSFSPTHRSRRTKQLENGEFLLLHGQNILYRKKHLLISICRIVEILANVRKNSGSIPRNACVRLRNIAMCDYQESVTDRRTDRRRTKWSLCAAMLRGRHKNSSNINSSLKVLSSYAFAILQNTIYHLTCWGRTHENGRQTGVNAPEPSRPPESSLTLESCFDGIQRKQRYVYCCAGRCTWLTYKGQGHCYLNWDKNIEIHWNSLLTTLAYNDLDTEVSIFCN